MKTWQVIDAMVTSDAREAAAYGLMEAGAIGTETTDDTKGRLTCGVLSTLSQQDGSRARA